MNAVNIACPPNIRRTRDPESAPLRPGVTFRWDQYTNPDYLRTLLMALMLIQQRTLDKGNVLRRCNAYFVGLGNIYKPKGFEDVWKDPAVLICFWPGTKGHSMLGATKGRLITISERAFVAMPNPVLIVAGTLIHELAHVAGAQLGTQDAEKSLEFCGFEDVQTKGLVG